MALCHINWFSGVLGKAIGTYVLLPDGDVKPAATMYLLHGLSDDYTIWQRRTRIEMYAAKYPMIVVMPDGFRNFYTNNEQGPAYAKYIGEELPAFIERTFHAPASRNARCLTGLSMGGYGALRVALGYPDRFASAVSHSGALMAGSRPTKGSNVSWAEEMGRIYGEDPTGTDHDLFHLVSVAKRKKKKLPALRIDCGTEDFLLTDNRTCHERLKKLKVPHEYEEFPGGHTWDYWDLHVREAIAFHARALRLKG